MLCMQGTQKKKEYLLYIHTWTWEQVCRRLRTANITHLEGSIQQAARKHEHEVRIGKHKNWDTLKNYDNKEFETLCVEQYDDECQKTEFEVQYAQICNTGNTEDSNEDDTNSAVSSDEEDEYLDDEDEDMIVGEETEILEGKCDNHAQEREETDPEYIATLKIAEKSQRQREKFMVQQCKHERTMSETRMKHEVEMMQLRVQAETNQDIMGMMLRSKLR